MPGLTRPLRFCRITPVTLFACIALIWLLSHVGRLKNANDSELIVTLPSMKKTVASSVKPPKYPIPSVLPDRSWDPPSKLPVPHDAENMKKLFKWWFDQGRRDKTTSFLCVGFVLKGIDDWNSTLKLITSHLSTVPISAIIVQFSKEVGETEWNIIRGFAKFIEPYRFVVRQPFQLHWRYNPSGELTFSHFHNEILHQCFASEHAPAAWLVDTNALQIADCTFGIPQFVQHADFLRKEMYFHFRNDTYFAMLEPTPSVIISQAAYARIGPLDQVAGAPMNRVGAGFLELLEYRIRAYHSFVYPRTLSSDSWVSLWYSANVLSPQCVSLRNNWVQSVVDLLFPGSATEPTVDRVNYLDQKWGIWLYDERLLGCHNNSFSRLREVVQLDSWRNQGFRTPFNIQSYSFDEGISAPKSITCASLDESVNCPSCALTFRLSRSSVSLEATTSTGNKCNLCQYNMSTPNNNSRTKQLNSDCRGSALNNLASLLIAGKNTATEAYRDKMVVPAFGVLVTTNDFIFFPKMLRELHLPIANFFVVQNDASDEMHLYFECMQTFLVQDGKQLNFTFLHFPENEGVASGWNRIAEAAFSRGPHVSLLWLSNSDFSVSKPIAQRFLSRSYEIMPTHATHLLVGFASFILMRPAAEKIGLFDEAVYPAYGEDVEYLLRATAAGIPCEGFPMPPPGSFVHFESATIKRGGNSRAARMHRWSRADYIYRKWGFDMTVFTSFDDHGAITYKYPFNQPEIPFNATFVDPQHRACVRTGNGIRYRCHGNLGGCWYNTAPIAQKYLKHLTVREIEDRNPSIFSNKCYDDVLLQVFKSMLARGAAEKEAQRLPDIPIFTIFLGPNTGVQDTWARFRASIVSQLAFANLSVGALVVIGATQNGNFHEFALTWPTKLPGTFSIKSVALNTKAKNLWKAAVGEIIFHGSDEDATLWWNANYALQQSDLIAAKKALARHYTHKDSTLNEVWIDDLSKTGGELVIVPVPLFFRGPVKLKYPIFDNPAVGNDPSKMRELMNNFISLQAELGTHVNRT